MLYVLYASTFKKGADHSIRRLLHANQIMKQYLENGITLCWLELASWKR